MIQNHRKKMNDVNIQLNRYSIKKKRNMNSLNSNKIMNMYNIYEYILKDILKKI